MNSPTNACLFNRAISCEKKNTFGIGNHQNGMVIAYQEKRYM